MRGSLIAVHLVLTLVAAYAEPEIRVDRATVTLDHRPGADWCVLDAQVSALLPISLDRLVAVVEDYTSYPLLFSRIREAHVVTNPEATLLSETVVVNALGIENVNRFTLRLKARAEPRSWRLSWTQEATDGTIDSLEGGWEFLDTGTPDKPLTRVIYRTKSAVPIRVVGQDVVLRWFLGSETQAVVDAVFKKALSR